MVAAGPVISDWVPWRRVSPRGSGNAGIAAACAPGGQRPRAGVRASWAQEARPAGTPPNDDGAPSAVAGIEPVTGFLWITVSPVTPWMARSRVSVAAGMVTAGAFTSISGALN